MATRTFQPAGATGNWSLAANWSDSTKPIAGDTVIIADGKTCYIDESTPRLAMLRNSATGLRNGNMLINNGISVTFDYCDTGILGAGASFIKNNGNVSATINGSITMGATADNYGVYNDGTGTLYVNGNLTGGSASNARGGFNYSTGKIIVNGKVTGGTNVNAPGLRNHNANGRCYVNGDIQAGWTGAEAVVAFYNNADSYHFQSYGGRLLDKDGNVENRAGTPTSINSRGGSLLYNWLITAEVDSAADFAAINNLVGDANVSFVQTGDFEVTTPANIGSVAAFLGIYTGYDAVAQRQRAVTFTYGDGSQTGIASLFQSNTGTLSRIKCTFAVNLDEEESTDAAIVHTNNSGGSVVDCVSGGTINADDAIGVCHTNAGLVKTSYTVAEDLGGNPLQTIRTNIGTVTNCYHLHIVDTQGVTVLTLPQMQGKGMNLDYINVWQEDIGGRDNTWLPYLRDGRYIKRRREPVGAF